MPGPQCAAICQTGAYCRFVTSLGLALHCLPKIPLFVFTETSPTNSSTVTSTGCQCMAGYSPSSAHGVVFSSCLSASSGSLISQRRCASSGGGIEVNVARQDDPPERWSWMEPRFCQQGKSASPLYIVTSLPDLHLRLFGPLDPCLGHVCFCIWAMHVKQFLCICGAQLKRWGRCSADCT